VTRESVDIQDLRRAGRALRALEAGIPTPIRRRGADRWLVPLPGAACVLSTSHQARLVAWLAAAQDEGWPTLADAVLAAADAIGLDV
jgi:hypothetical protein